MQTFLPYPNLACSAAVLDRQRLGKQRLECRQILQALVHGGGWRNHPAVRMWTHHRSALMLYHDVVIREWERRGYRNEMQQIRPETAGPVTMPPWLGSDAYHSCHRATLLAKDPTHYGEYGWEEDALIGYRWPQMSSPTEYTLTELR